MKSTSSPKIGILVPAYNTERFITAALASIQDQTETQFEVLVVDDGSTDGTLSEAKQFENDDSRFTVVPSRHIGVTAIRNLGLSHFKTVRYLAALDSDNIWHPDFLATMLHHLERSPPQIVGVFAQCIGVKDDGELLFRGADLLNEIGFGASGEVDFHTYVGDCFPADGLSRMVFRREAFSGLKYQWDPLEDLELLTRMLFRNRELRFLGINDHLTASTSRTGQITEDRSKTWREFCRLMYEYAPKVTDPQLQRQCFDIAVRGARRHGVEQSIIDYLETCADIAGQGGAYELVLPKPPFPTQELNSISLW